MSGKAKPPDATGEAKYFSDGAGLNELALRSQTKTKINRASHQKNHRRPTKNKNHPKTKKKCNTGAPQKTGMVSTGDPKTLIYGSVPKELIRPAGMIYDLSG